MKFLRGTYGIDLLSLFLLLIGSTLNLFFITLIFGLIFTFIAIFRAFSKNTYARKNELIKFITLSNKFLSRFNKSLPYNLPVYDLNNVSFVFSNIEKWIKQKRQFKIIKCPICAQKLRLPRGKGKIVVTCKKCNNKFDSKC